MQIKGRCERIEYVNQRTGISTFLFLVFSDKQKIRAIGPIKDLVRNDIYILDGEMLQDGSFRFGRSRKSTDCRQESIDILAGAGIGLTENTAKSVVNTLGDDLFAYGSIKGLSGILQTIKGIGAKKAEAIMQLIKESTNENEAFQYLARYEVPYVAVMAYFNKVRSDQLLTIQKEPYQLMEYDVAFRICDKIALENGTDAWSLNRIQAAIRSVELLIRKNGNTRMKWESFFKTAKSMLISNEKKTDPVPGEILEWMMYANPYIKIYQDGNQTYIAPLELYLNEKAIVNGVNRIIETKKPVVSDATPYISLVEQELGITYNEGQRASFKLLETGGICILTGGPGTGKTTVISGLVKGYMDANPKGTVLLCAPTGRAAARMSEISQLLAKTIHKALKLRWFDHKRKIEMLEYDFIICDEMSMCDTELLSQLLSAIKPGTLILFSGDINQLPSVGPGQVFRDLIECEKIPTFYLTELVRQSEGSLIAQNAKRILKGQNLITGKDFAVRVAKNDGQLLMEVKALYQRILSAGKQKDLQIICPIKKTGAGTYAINRTIQSLFDFSNHGIWINGTEFHAADRIIMNSNNYEAGYMNGDVGIIKEIQNGVLHIMFSDKELKLEIFELDDMDLAYALTVHKSQGAECEYALIVLPEESACMASREILYTAITRAKRGVMIWSVEGLLLKYIQGTGKARRDCSLKSGLQGKILYE